MIDEDQAAGTTALDSSGNKELEAVEHELLTFSIWIGSESYRTGSFMPFSARCRSFRVDVASLSCRVGRIVEDAVLSAGS